MIQQKVKEKKRGLVVLAPGTGNIAPQHLTVLKGAAKKGIAVVFGSQMTGGKIQAESYELGRAAEEAGLVPANDMTPYAARAKTIWALGIMDELERKGQLKPVERPQMLKTLFNHTRAGEMTPSKGMGWNALPKIVKRLDRNFGKEDRVPEGKW